MLLATFEVMRLPDNIKNILLTAMNEYSGFDMVEENSLHFEEPFKDREMEIVEDQEWADALHEPELPPDTCTRDDEDLSYEYKLRAVEYWRSGKTGNLGLGSVKQKFKKVQSIRQLRRWAHNLNKGGTYKEKLARICGYTLENFKAAVDAGLIVHDSDLKKWALHAQKEVGHTDFRFKASRTWINSFKAAHRIVSRKINKFITSKTIEDGKVLEQQSQKFVDDVKQNIRTYELSNTFNADQSGFQLEMHSGRT
ncbi:uncharacterized protein [Venturia canescens]|uniref:uncharacterized protein n=1 Tax=Venturia canescens TaxID=32260 RepID=UPI001C9C775C|nr:uncharacterized protein LOC122414393 [Venturia canescens]XP_043282399.1 uncharacterized protein LOC122414860 [Venturia canescens]